MANNNPCRTCAWFCASRCYKFGQIVTPDAKEQCWTPPDLTLGDLSE